MQSEICAVQYDCFHEVPKVSAILMFMLGDYANECSVPKGLSAEEKMITGRLKQKNQVHVYQHKQQLFH